MDIQLLDFLVNGGATAFLIYLVIRLMTRIDIITDRIIERQEQGAAERKVLAGQLGLQTSDLSREAAKVRRKQLRQEEID